MIYIIWQTWFNRFQFLDRTDLIYSTSYLLAGRYLRCGIDSVFHVSFHYPSISPQQERLFQQEQRLQRVGETRGSPDIDSRVTKKLLKGFIWDSLWLIVPENGFARFCLYCKKWFAWGHNREAHFITSSVGSLKNVMIQRGAGFAPKDCQWLAKMVLVTQY